jgi:hypothetical protein
MANECTVFEMQTPRSGGSAPIRPVPFLARTQVSSTGTVTFTKSTVMVSIYSTLAGTVDFTSTAGVAPTGALAPFPIAANTLYDFDVRPGTKVRFD